MKSTTLRAEVVPGGRAMYMFLHPCECYRGISSLQELSLRVTCLQAGHCISRGVNYITNINPSEAILCKHACPCVCCKHIRKVREKQFPLHTCTYSVSLVSTGLAAKTDGVVLILQTSERCLWILLRLKRYRIDIYIYINVYICKL